MHTLFLSIIQVRIALRSFIFLLLTGMWLRGQISPPHGNAWMRVPTLTSSAPDEITAAARKARDRYFDSLIGADEPLTQENAGQYHSSEGSTYKRPEILRVKDDVWVTAAFLSHAARITASRRAIYNELNMQAETVFRSAKSGLSSGQSFQIVFPGGAVQDTATGEMIEFLVDPKKYVLEPGRTYLLQLAYYAPLQAFEIVKSWDITSGVVEPNSPDDVQRKAQHLSALIGLKVDQLQSVLPSLLRIQN